MKKLIITTVSILLLSTLFANTSVTLTKAANDNSSIVNVAINSSADVYGIQFDVKYDPSVLSIDATDLASMVPGVDQVYGRVKSDGLLRVVMFDLNGNPLHNSEATTSIISLPFRTDNDNSINTLIEFENVVVAGMNGANIDASYDNFSMQIDEFLPTETSLSPAYPNPFNPSTTIDYSIAIEGKVTLQVFDIKGSLVKTLVSDLQSPSNYSVVWNGRDENGRMSASGEYFVRLTTPGFSDNTKITLMK